MRMAEYKQVSTEIVKHTVVVDDYDENGEKTGEHEETVEREVPVMGMVYRDSTPEEDAAAAEAQAEAERMEAEREPTFEERMEAQVMYTALMTDTLLMEEE